MLIASGYFLSELCAVLCVTVWCLSFNSPQCDFLVPSVELCVVWLRLYTVLLRFEGLNPTCTCFLCVREVMRVFFDTFVKCVS